MKPLNPESLSARLLGKLAWAVIHRRQWFFWPQIILFGLSILYTVKYLEFRTNRNDLVGSGKKYHQNFLAFKKEFPTQDDLVVVVESENAEKNRQFVERIGAKLEAETNLFMHVFYKGDLKMLGSKALLFVPEPDLLELRKKLNDYLPFVEPFTHTTNLVSLFDMINTQFRTAKRERNEQTESLIRAIPALERIVTQATASLRRGGSPPSPGVFALFAAGPEAERSVYITFAQGQIYLVTAQALKEELNSAAVLRLRQLVEETRAEVPGINVGITGEPVLVHDEMKQSQSDTTVASIVSLIICALIFIYGYNETGRPLKATVCLVVGLGYTMAFTTAVVGHLNILTVTFVPILIGLAIDFGVHLVTRYEEELHHGKSEAEAMTKALVFTGQGIFTGAFTTAGAFLAMGFTDFKGIQEMGIICGGGLLVCLVPMLTLLPVLLLRGRQNVLDHELVGKVDHRERIENLWLRRPVLVIIVTVVLCAASAWQMRKVYFDYNLLNMQSEGLPAVEFAKKLIDSTAEVGKDGETNASARTVLFAAVVTDSLTQAVELEQRIKQLPAVADVDSIAKFLTENQAEKLRLIGEVKKDLAPLRFDDADRQPVNVLELSRSLYSLNGYIGLAREEAQKEDAAVMARLTTLYQAIEVFRKEMLRGSAADQPVVAAQLGNYQRALFDDLRSTFEALQQQDNREKLRVEDLPPALRDRFVGIHGKQLLQVYPKENVWQRGPQEEFVRQVRTIDPNVTGTPVQLLEYTTLLKRSYEEAAVYSLIAIAILVLIHFRSIGSVILALLPVAIGSSGWAASWAGLTFR